MSIGHGGRIVCFYFAFILFLFVMIWKNIYLVTLPEDLVFGNYDCYAGHVVYAKGPQEAKKICSEISCGEGSRVRLEEATAIKVGETKKGGEGGIILSDYRAG